ncbi:MAG: hypothetical protein HY297_03590 [Thaumarchaeota archaeon]|nr:hypothetical protein [Nitrososphaerota archaeon]
MSNTSYVSPYEPSAATTSAVASVAAGAAAVCVVGAVAGAVAVVQWLAEETPEDRAALERAKEERRWDLVESALRRSITLGDVPAAAPSITSLGLHTRQPESLIRSAEKLGYRLEQPLRRQKAHAEPPIMLLRSDAGERMALERTAHGQLVIHTAGDRRRVEALVRQHTVDRVMEHLGRKGMRVRAAKLPNGEVQVLAQEQDPGRAGGAAELKAQVRLDGTSWVDVDRMQGPRCEEIVRELADAIGGQVSQICRKDSYYQLPGEPARTRVTV